MLQKDSMNQKAVSKRFHESNDTEITQVPEGNFLSYLSSKWSRISLIACRHKNEN